MGIDVTELLDLDFDQQFSIGQGTRQDIKSDKKGFKFKDVEINLDPKRGIGNRNKVEDEEVEDALRNIQESLTKTKVADIKAKPVSAIRTVDAPITKFEQVASIDPRTPVVETQDPALAQTPDVDYDFFDSDELMVMPESTTAIEDTGAFLQSDQGQDTISTGLNILKIPDKAVGTSFLPGYQQAETGKQAMKLAEMRGSSSYYQTSGSPTLTGQLAGAGMAITSAYSAFDALKGGIDSPTEALQFAGGTLGTLAGLQTAGIMAGSQFATMMAGPVGWAIAGASFLAASGILGGKGKSKPPMGGVEFRLVDDAGNQYTNVQEGQKRKIKAVNAHSYNGFNSSALQAQANKNVDYMYAFADKFDLKVNEKAWSQAAFGGDGVDKYMPRGREAPYRSVLERIDSMGDGSVSPSEWLRHAMEYEGPNGERIVEGDIYKGVRIGPDGMPMKVGYKTQEEFQEAVADFNKQFYA